MLTKLSVSTTLAIISHASLIFRQYRATLTISIMIAEMLQT
jgi:hypothetical protein